MTQHTEHLKAVVDQALFLKALGRVSRVVQKRNTIPIISNILVEVGQDGIQVRACDLDMDLADTVKADVASKGATTVPGHMLFEIVRKMPAGCQITIETDDQVMTVKSGRSRFRLQMLPPGDFPGVEAQDITHSFSMAAKELAKLVDYVSFAISTEETRYYLNGIYFHTATSDTNKPSLRGVATDGHRLARCDLDLPEGAAGMPGIIIPRKTIGEMERLFKEMGDAQILVEVSTNKIRFSSGTVIMTSKLIDGTFPDYGRVIPQNNDKVLTVGVKDLQQASDRVTTVSSERGRAVKLSLTPGKVVLSVSNADAGSAVDEVDADFEGDSLEVGFNSQYLHDVLMKLNGEKATINLADPGSPGLFRGDDLSTLYVVMPMRV